MESNVPNSKDDKVSGSAKMSEPEGPEPPKGSNSQQIRSSRNRRKRALVHDAHVEVLLSSQQVGTSVEPIQQAWVSPRLEGQVQATMTISIWNVDSERYYTCSFTSTASNLPNATRIQSRAISRSATNNALSKASESGPASPISPNRSSDFASGSSSAVTPSSGTPISYSPFPPLGAPAKSDISSVPSILKK